MAEKKIPKRVLTVINKLRGGQRVCKSLRLKESGETEVLFFFEPSWKRCGPQTAEASIKSGKLTAAGDGLFEPEFSQTWTVA